MGVLDSLDEKEGSHVSPPLPRSGKVLVGTVEHFFEKLKVAAVKLDKALQVGNIIEIGGEDEAIRQRVTGMQIDREDVSQASEGESVGIKVIHPVQKGSNVYRIDTETQ